VPERHPRRRLREHDLGPPPFKAPAKGTDSVDGPESASCRPPVEDIKAKGQFSAQQFDHFAAELLLLTSKQAKHNNIKEILIEFAVGARTRQINRQA